MIVCLCAASFWQARAATPARPNIILLLVDDMGWMDSSLYGSTYYETPGMERLAREGMKFDAAYVQPLCSPTRATLLTGRDAPTRFRMHKAITGGSANHPVVPPQARPYQAASWPQSRSHLPLEERTMAEALRDAGYQTWHLGKWHLGNVTRYGPQKQGFEKVLGAGGAGPGGSYFAPYRIPMLEPGPDGEYICERLTDEACTLLEERDPDKPFFMYLAHFNVHAPYMAKPDLVDHFKKTADPDNPQHNPVMAAMLRSMDDSLSRLLDKLDALRLADNTLFVFLSDNGGVHWKSRIQGEPEEQVVTSNLPLRGGKCSFYEGGIRVPMIVRLPGETEGGSTCRVPVHALDLYPTFLDYADAKPLPGQRLDGETLKPLLTQEGGLQRDALFGHFPRARTTAGTLGGSWVRQGDYKLIRRWFEGEDRKHRYELYDLGKDIGEQHNFAADMPERGAAMAALLDAWLEETGALLPIRNPRWRAHSAAASTQGEDEK